MRSTHISSSQGSTRRGLHAAEAAELSPRASPPSPMSVTCYQCEQCDHSPSLPTPHPPPPLPLSISLCMCFYSEEHMSSSLHLPCCTGLSPGITTLHLEAATGHTNLLWKDATRRVHLELFHGGLISSFFFGLTFQQMKLIRRCGFVFPLFFIHGFLYLLSLICRSNP